MKRILIVLMIFFTFMGVKRMFERSTTDPKLSGEPDMPLTWPAELGPDTKIEPVERRTARNYYVVFDASGSMTETKCSGSQRKIEVAKTAVQEFATKIAGDANIGLMIFDNRGPREALPLGKDQLLQFKNLVSSIDAGGGTPLRSAIYSAGQNLAKQAARQMGYGEYHLVVVTDGEADEGQDPRTIVGTLLKGTPVVLHTVGFCIGSKHSLNQPGLVLYQSADNPEELRQGLKEVLAEASSFNVDEFKAQ
jgi:Ca-activated chloride channel family protein